MVLESNLEVDEAAVPKHGYPFSAENVAGMAVEVDDVTVLLPF
jgi:hypothetical protein